MGTPQPPESPQFCTHRSHPTQYLDPFSSPPFTMGIHFVRIWKVSRGKGLSAQPGEGEAAPRQAGTGHCSHLLPSIPSHQQAQQPRDAGCPHQDATSLLSCCEGATLGRAQLLLAGVSNPQSHRAGGHLYVPTPQDSTETPVLGTPTGPAARAGLWWGPITLSMVTSLVTSYTTQTTLACKRSRRGW